MKMAVLALMVLFQAPGWVQAYAPGQSGVGEGNGHLSADHLYGLKARYYDAEAKRFLSADPIGLDGGNNLYLYADANPLFFIDPLGLDVVVLNESQGAQGFGHQGIAVGNDFTGWKYFSQDGPSSGGGHALQFATVDDMNRVLGQRYDNRLVISTSFAQDEAIGREAAANLHNPYSANPLAPNRYHCADLVSDALRAGQVPTGQETAGNWPNKAFQRISQANALRAPLSVYDFTAASVNQTITVSASPATPTTVPSASATSGWFSFPESSSGTTGPAK